MPDATNHLLRLLDHHRPSAYSLLQELPSPPDRAIFLYAEATLADVTRLRARAQAIINRRQRSSRLTHVITRSTELSRIIHHSLDRMLRRQLSMKIMQAYRRRGELLQGSEFFRDQPCVDLYQQWKYYLAAERWLAASSGEFPTDPVDGLNLIDLWIAQGRPGFQ